MEEEHTSIENEMHMEHLEDEAEDIYDEDELICGHCCKDRLIQELETRDMIRNIVMPGAMIYDAGDIRKFLMFLSMYPALALVSEVVDEITAHYEESERQ